MAFQDPREFGSVATQAPYGSQITPASKMAERKPSISVGDGGFVSPSHEWHDLPMDAKHVADGMNDLALGAGSTMNGASFKAEPGWSPHDQTSGYGHGNDFDPLMSEYGQPTGPGPLNLQYDPNVSTGPPSANSLATMATIPSQGQFPMSPQSQNWLNTPVAESFDFSPLAPQGTRHTPVFATSTSILRRDGIRKKNARFEIPAERNLRTIDQLIAQTSDETEIKELKQQKRLLRNRQAALDSRQRKKQHTERLEEEKKQYTGIITDLEDENTALKTREADWMHQRDEWIQRHTQLQQYIQALQQDKDQTMQRMTSEINEMRKDNAILLEQMQKISEHGRQAGSSGPSTDFSDFDQLTLQNSPWDNYAMHANDFSIEAEHPDTSMPGSSNKASNAVIKKGANSAASGILLMLLLYGAWAISKGTSETAEPLPSVSEDLREASRSVIEDLYRDSGIHLPDSAVGAGPQLLQSADTMPNQHIEGGMPYDRHMSASYTTETANAQQALGQIHSDSFTLSNQPRGSVVSQPNTHPMADALKDAIRSVHSNVDPLPTPETYTKSLLVDKVPNQVLKEFAQMVSKVRSRKTEPTIMDHIPPAYD